MAELYLGVQRGAAGFERRIVIKRVRAAYCADPATREALVDEAHVAMSLNHSNIVQVLDLGFAAGRYFLVLELVDGWDLSVLLDRAKQSEHPLPPELALHISAEVCRALAFAHGRTKDGAPLGIVHRDINPHNVLISEQGEVKLTDFGIATARTKRRSQTLVGVVKGKLGFMSPEQAKGEDVLDARSDIFSLGCTIYQVATGFAPFSGGTELEMLLRMEHCAFTPLEQSKPDLPPELGAVITRAMKKAPADRYPSAEEMLIDLERVQRSAFRPVGQSELKTWIAELARLDEVPTIGKRPPAVSLAAQGELAQGTTLILEEIESDPGAVQRTLSPPVITQPELEALPSGTELDLKPPPLPPRVPTPSAIAQALPEPAPASERKPTPLPAATPEAKPPDPIPALAKPPERKLTPAQVPAAKPERKLTPAQVPAAKPERKLTPAQIPAAKPPDRRLTPAAVPMATVPLTALTPTNPVDAPELPRWVLSGAIFLVIVLLAMVATVFVARPKRLAASADAGQVVVDAGPAGDTEIAYPMLGADEVPVPVETTPAGASISLNGHLVGTSPMDVRLSPGRAYELRFEKPGYRVLVRKFTIAAGKKPAKVSAPLEKLKWYLPQ